MNGLVSGSTVDPWNNCLRFAQGIQEVSDATDHQAATTEEVASMVDALVADLDEVAEEVETIAAANEEQTAQIHEIAETARQLGSE